MLFRDFLPARPDVANEYGLVKRRLAREFRNDRRGYVAAKEPFVWKTIRRADSWAQETG